MNIFREKVINKKSLQLIKNFSFVIASNIVSVAISIVVILLLPKFIGFHNYGYWQLYILYTSFVGLLHFGWNDGLYLRYGGDAYEEIDKKLIFSQFYLLLLSQIAIASIGFLIVTAFEFHYNKAYVLYMTAIHMIIVNVRYMLLFLLQATYRIKEYSFITILDRVLYLILVSILLLFDIKDFRYFLWMDIIGMTLSLFLAIFYCKDIVFHFFEFTEISVAFSEMLENIRVGIKLMLSNIAGKLVVGNVRLGIEAVWNVAIFGKVSLMLSITSFAMIFINSISLVLFPFLRKTKQSDLGSIYINMRHILTFFLLIFLLSSYPLSFLLELWLPEYADSLKYIFILYPIILFEGKMSLLVNTYLKVLRKEGVLLKINAIAFFVSIALTLSSVFVLKSIDAAMYSIVFLSFIKLFIAEVYIQKILNINFWKDILFELLVLAILIVFQNLLTLQNSAIVFIASLFIYFVIVRSRIINSIGFFKKSILSIN